jgi:hypothetical protein
MLDKAAVYIQEGKIAGIYEENKIPEYLNYLKKIDIGGNIVAPGFVDSHTHLGYTYLPFFKYNNTPVRPKSSYQWIALDYNSKTSVLKNTEVRQNIAKLLDTEPDKIEEELVNLELFDHIRQGITTIESSLPSKVRDKFYSYEWGPRLVVARYVYEGLPTLKYIRLIKEFPYFQTIGATDPLQLVDVLKNNKTVMHLSETIELKKIESGSIDKGIYYQLKEGKFPKFWNTYELEQLNTDLLNILDISRAKGSPWDKQYAETFIETLTNRELKNFFKRECGREIYPKKLLSKFFTEFYYEFNLKIDSIALYLQELVESKQSDKILDILCRLYKVSPDSSAIEKFNKILFKGFGVDELIHPQILVSPYQQILSRVGEIPLLNALDLLDNVVGFHVFSLKSDIDSLRKLEGVIINPSSNINLFGKLPLVKEYLAANITLGIGSDAIWGNNNLADDISIFKNLNIDPETIYKCITENPSKIYDLNTGCIEEGKDADIVIFDISNYKGDKSSVREVISYLLTFPKVEGIIVNGKIIGARNDAGILQVKIGERIFKEGHNLRTAEVSKYISTILTKYEYI